MKMFHGVWEGFGLCCALFVLFMVLPSGFYIIRFLRRQIIQNSYSGTSLLCIYWICMVSCYGLCDDCLVVLRWHGLCDSANLWNGA